MVDAVRLPEDVERGANGGPAWRTIVQTLSSGNEQRIQEWQEQRGAWQIGYGITTLALLQAVVDLFQAQKGRAFAFLFKDWSDFAGTAEATVPTVGDAVETDFQMTRNYDTAVRSYARPITQTIDATVNVYIDTILQVSGFTLEAGGIIRFSSPPAGGEVITADFEFDVPVRFNQDNLNIDVEVFDKGSIPDISIIEVREI